MEQFSKDYAIKLTEEEYDYCIENFDDYECKEKLFRGHIKLALWVSSRFFSDRHDRSELDSEALAALWKAILQFEPSKGCRLTTFASRVIYNVLSKYLRKHKDHPADGSLNIPINGYSEDKQLDLIDVIWSGKDEFNDYENSLLVKEGLELLTDEEREIFIDYYLNDKTQLDIAAERKCTQVNVSRLVLRSVNRMIIYFATGKKCRGNVFLSDVEIAKNILKKNREVF